MDQIFLCPTFTLINSLFTKVNYCTTYHLIKPSWNDNHGLSPCMGGEVASWLVRLMDQVPALTEGTVLCSWENHFSLTVPLSTQVHKWVLAKLMLGDNPAKD